MIEGATEPTLRRELKPVARRASWVAWGVAMQAVGVGIPVAVAVRHASRDGALGSVTHYTVRLVWHEMLRSHADLALLSLGVILFVAGAVVMARPFVRRRLTLLVAVPIAAVAGLAVLGVLALVCAAAIALLEDPSGAEGIFSGISWPGGRKRDRRG